MARIRIGSPTDSHLQTAMLFNSYAFWLFYLAVAVAYFLLPHKGQNRLLLVASYFFYGCWDWRFLSLIAISTVVDYYTALGIDRSEGQRRRKLLLFVSMAMNLGLLGVFKYYGFFAGELSTLLNQVGVPVLLPTLSIVLPVGISFYTFQTMSYTIDVYRKVTPATDRFLDFALYVCFFPQLVAGPIERSSRLLPQVLEPRPRAGSQFAEGLYHVMIGLFKKVVIADNMAAIANAVFATPTASLTGPECLIGVYAFAFQIYGDFSGYSSIAQGVAKWFGFDLMTNFRMPYFATTPSDFWRRWHISLSQWLRDYLYIPLGGNRGGGLLTYRNLMLTMILGGLWHGAGWTFLAWGLLHGLLLCAYRPFERKRAAERKAATESGITPELATGFGFKLRYVFAVLLMFHLVCAGWLFFRAETIGQAFGFLTLIATSLEVTPFVLSAVGLFVFYCGPLLAYELWLERKGDLLSLPKIFWLPRAVAYSYCVLMMLFFPPSGQQEFIYFQF